MSKEPKLSDAAIAWAYRYECNSAHVPGSDAWKLLDLIERRAREEYRPSARDTKGMEVTEAEVEAACIEWNKVEHKTEKEAMRAALEAAARARQAGSGDAVVLLKEAADELEYQDEQYRREDPMGLRETPPRVSRLIQKLRATPSSASAPEATDADKEVYASIAKNYDASAPEAVPVAWMEPHEGGCVPAAIKQAELWASIYTIPLYATARNQLDSKDAARYRWLKNEDRQENPLATISWRNPVGFPCKLADSDSLDDLIDAAPQRAGGDHGC